MLAVTSEGFAVAGKETVAAGLVAAVGAGIVAGELATGDGDCDAVGDGVGIPINSLCRALSLEPR